MTEYASPLSLYPFQEEAINNLRQRIRDGHKHIILCAPTGAGKCHPRGTMILLADGTEIDIAYVLPNMALMGPDGLPRYITSISHGYGKIVIINPAKGKQWRCNLDHVLTLIDIRDTSRIIDVSVKNWLSVAASVQQHYKLFRVRIPKLGEAIPQAYQIKSKHSFTIKPLEQEQIYYGFTLEGDGRYLLADRTVTHNTEMAIELICEANAKGSQVVFVADRIALVSQAHKRLAKYGIIHGVIQGENTYGRYLPIQVASAQTIERREEWPNLKLLLLDEAHIQRKKITEFIKLWDGIVIGLTATPLTPNLHKSYSVIVNAATTNELLEQKRLAPLKMYAATEIDMEGADAPAGEWTSTEVRTRGRKVIGNILAEWVKMTHIHFGGPVKTLLFSADIAHGEELCEAFQAAGYDFRQSTYRDDAEKTRKLVEAFERGEFIGLVSVEKFCRGFDVPDVKCIIGARPYRTSLSSVIQQIGRGMRAAPGKEFCLYLDHSGNLAGWYAQIAEIWENGVPELPRKDKKEKKKPRKEGEEREEVSCHKCGYIIPPKTNPTHCPSCGEQRQRKKRSDVRNVQGRMEEVIQRRSDIWHENRDWTWHQLCRLAWRWRKPDFSSAQQFALRLYRNIYGEWPSGRFKVDPSPPDNRVAKFVRVMHQEMAEAERQIEKPEQ